MTRVFPPELDSELPGPHASTRRTSAPMLRSCSAVQPPKAPAPTTTIRCGDVRPNTDFAKGRAASDARKDRRESVIVGFLKGGGIRRHPSDALEAGSCRDAEGT